ncbi:hypothetical protein ANN_16920 [Periplaneta americana]|uniref:Uncharacterized protein n=1 Tax=Periplaneta americana TaxID=6978 RepID=A0ABQ8SS94_PERAM|nr:hypothetical protein ANN_16920 [Periplaneta americana]
MATQRCLHGTCSESRAYLLPVLIWQQDGAPPHFGVGVRDFLNQQFHEWIGHRGTTEWPPRSCDLTPCDFSLWGILKNDVFAQKPQDLHRNYDR